MIKKIKEEEKEGRKEGRNDGSSDQNEKDHVSEEEEVNTSHPQLSHI